MKNKNATMLGVVAIVIVAAVLGFFGGMQYQKNTVVTQASQFANNRGMMGNGNFEPQNGSNGSGQNRMIRKGMQPVSGDIISVDANGITVKAQDGSSKIIVVSDKTAITKSSTATKTDLKVGEKVTAFGTTNADGSVTAQAVSLGNAILRANFPRQNGLQPNPSVSPNQ